MHGSIHHLQCARPCSNRIWENHESFRVDGETMLADRVPLCPRCGAAVRPTILLCGDYGWTWERAACQREHCDRFLTEQNGTRIGAHARVRINSRVIAFFG